MKRIRTILVSSAVFCVLALAGAWWAVHAYADRQVGKMLGHSREFFVQMLENTLDGVLWYAGGLAAYHLDYSTEPKSVEEMQRLAALLYIDELTVVPSNGVAVSSNYGEFVGFDWHTTPQTSAYFSLLDHDNKTGHLAEDFRRCVLRSDHYRKYAGVAFTNRLGFVQVGYSMDRLVRTLAWSDAESFAQWKFGQYGRFGALDRDGDGLPDEVNAAEADGISLKEVDKVLLEDGGWHRLTFPFAGRLFYAELPEREFGDLRNMAFLAVAVVIVSLTLLFTALLMRLRLSAVRVENLHREADRRAAADLALAHTIQMSTLPRTSSFNPDCLAYDLEALMIPAREVGGDLYDFFVLADGRVAVVIGDVSGKGVPSAMFMLLAKSAIRQALLGQGDPAVAMAAANAALCADNAAEMFVTMVLGVLDPVLGELTYVNAGHNRPFVVRADGAVERLEVRGGRLLGLFPGLEYRASHLRLAPGDRLFLYTDGVTEAQDAGRHLYGEARLRNVLGSMAASLCAAVRADVARHVADAPASDDLTMLALGWRGAPVRAVRTFPCEEASMRAALDFLRAACSLSHHKDFARLLQAADEVVANVIGYSGASEFTLEVETGADRCKFVLSDEGVEYNPLAYPEPDIHAAIETRQVGGLGILLAKKFSNFISWRREGGQNRLTVVKYLR